MMNRSTLINKRHKLPWNELTEKFDVSVIVPTYNRAEYIQECIDSLLNQTRPALEIIVIDDGSEDNTAKIIGTYGAKIHYVHKENGGKPSAVNLGLSLARGNLIWIFDDDDVALPEAIESRVNALKNCPHVGFVYSPHYFGASSTTGKIKIDRLYRPPCYDKNIFFYFLLENCFFSLSSALVRIEAFNEVGKFDEDLFSSEDYDMLIRLSRKFEAAYCTAPTFVVREHSGERGAKVIRYDSLHRSQVFRKYDQIVGLKIRQNLSLNEYLILKTNEIKSESQERLALLSRMRVMGSKGCIIEMFEDLRQALKTLSVKTELEEQELQIITATIATGYAYDAIRSDWPTFEKEFLGLKGNTESVVAQKALVKGFFVLAKSYPDTILERFHKLFLFARLSALMIKDR